MALRDALLQAGFRPWPADALAAAEKQLIQLGRDRAGRLLQWLLEADLAMKGSHSSSDRARFVLEMLFLRQAKRQQPSGGANAGRPGAGKGRASAVSGS
jgi:DNA polymerase-3 subunit delta